MVVAPRWRYLCEDGGLSLPWKQKIFVLFGEASQKRMRTRVPHLEREDHGASAQEGAREFIEKADDHGQKLIVLAHRRLALGDDLVRLSLRHRSSLILSSQLSPRHACLC